jgi:hypothetical protein
LRGGGGGCPEPARTAAAAVALAPPHSKHGGTVVKSPILRGVS